MKFVVRTVGCILLSGTLLTSAASAAPAWPSAKPITLVVPYPPGGNADILGRLFAQQLSQKTGQTVVVDNKPGAGSMVGSYQVVRAGSDGYTFLLGSIANVLNQYFYKKPLYDMNKDLVPVSQLVNVPNYVAVGPTEKFRTMGEIITFAKANPKKLSCANTGVGTSTYLSCEMIKTMTGAELVNVPYKGGAAAMQDVMGGQANMVIANEALVPINDKRLIGIAVTSAKRSPLAPQLPPLSDTLPGFDVNSWYGVFAPVGVAKEILDQVVEAAAAMAKEEATLSRLKVIGATPVGSSQKDFAAFFKDEMAKWGEVTKKMNVQLD
ncbi:tripartite tricarboxylate transporter substrate-binding protein [Cupriavidus sp. BIC8F]|uniref:tripartite tricarboxylate transporter substrate-binding protein n=1 Tax=Cupriavidus sp. BIC8F TaxID=3079014 RepID=UPI002916A2FA|nr:tripartite tricarboxylate transporter substrate-binding protein [Cupriavidus sp. BIC8F]